MSRDEPPLPVREPQPPDVLADLAEADAGLPGDEAWFWEGNVQANVVPPGGDGLEHPPSRQYGEQ